MPQKVGCRPGEIKANGICTTLKNLFNDSMLGYLGAHRALLKEPKFNEYLERNGYKLAELNTFSAEHSGTNIWKYYIKVQTAKSLPQGIDDISTYNEWKYYNNGDIFYNPVTHEIRLKLIGKETVNL